jgi:hypothetical protein
MTRDRPGRDAGQGDVGQGHAGFGPFRGTSGTCLFGLSPSVTGTGCAGLRRPAGPVTGPAVRRATSPHAGQAPAAPSKEKQQPQKHATSAIVSSFFLSPWPRGPAGEGSGTSAL